MGIAMLNPSYLYRRNIMRGREGEMNPEGTLNKTRHSGAGRNPAISNIPRSGQKQGVVPLSREFIDQLDSGLRRNDGMKDYL
jgi:hypothetical protein